MEYNKSWTFENRFKKLKELLKDATQGFASFRQDIKINRNQFRKVVFSESTRKNKIQLVLFCFFGWIMSIERLKLGGHFGADLSDPASRDIIFISLLIAIFYLFCNFLFGAFSDTKTAILSGMKSQATADYHLVAIQEITIRELEKIIDSINNKMSGNRLVINIDQLLKHYAPNALDGQERQFFNTALKALDDFSQNKKIYEDEQKELIEIILWHSVFFDYIIPLSLSISFFIRVIWIYWPIICNSYFSFLQLY